MFNKDVYAGRRAALKKMLDKGIAFFPANNERPSTILTTPTSIARTATSPTISG